MCLCQFGEINVTVCDCPRAQFHLYSVHHDVLSSHVRLWGNNIVDGNRNHFSFYQDFSGCEFVFFLQLAILAFQKEET
jgi:hypothetical protein